MIKYFNTLYCKTTVYIVSIYNPTRCASKTTGQTIRQSRAGFGRLSGRVGGKVGLGRLSGKVGWAWAGYQAR